MPIGDLSILFDNLVGSGEQCRRHSEAEHPGRWNVNDQLELGRLHDRQIRRFRTLENAAGVNADVVIRIPQTCAVGHQSADFGMVAVLVYCGNRVACRQLSQLDPPVEQEGCAADDEGVRSLTHKSVERSIEFEALAGVENLDLQPHGASNCSHVSQ